MFEGLWKLWRELITRPCKHHWRPAVGMSSPVRYCDKCERHEPITADEFYAQFGKMPHRWTDGPMGGE